MRLFVAGILLSGAVCASAQIYGVTNGPIPTNGVIAPRTNALPGATAAQPVQPQGTQAAATEKPLVTVTVNGTVLTEEQKRSIAQKIAEIPGVVVITNKIHVVGQIEEAAGASRTNRGSGNRRLNRHPSF